MVLRKLIVEEEGKKYVQTVKVFDNPKRIKKLSSDLAWKILKTIREEALYPLKIAKRLDIHEQKVYYHINNLVEAGLIQVVKEKEIKGASAKFYSPSAPVFAVDLNYGKSLIEDDDVVGSKVIDFFHEFNKETFQGKIVVGSPEAHGPLQSWARDGHYSNFVSLFLGNFIKFSQEHFVELDIDVKAKEDYEDNFVLIGGPGVNVITFKFNEYLPVKFDTQFVGEAPRATFGKGFVSEEGDEVYNDPNVGVIEKIINPFDKNKSVVVLAGVSKKGTLSAILALTQNSEEVLNDYEKGKSFSRVVHGHDLSGDGRIDNVEVLE